MKYTLYKSGVIFTIKMFIIQISDMKKKFPLKKIIILTIIAIVWYYGYSYFFPKSVKQEFVTLKAKVRKWDIEDSVQVIWTSQVVNQQKLVFSQNWSVANVYVEEWDPIKKWQLLAELDKTDVQNNIRQAEVSLSNAKIKLDQLVKPPEQKDVIKAQSDIDSTKFSLSSSNDSLQSLITDKENKLSNLQNQLDAKKTDLTNKRSDLAVAQNDLDTLIKQESLNVSNFWINSSNTFESAYTDAKQYIIDAQTMLTSADKIFWISWTYRNNIIDYDIYLSAKNSMHRWLTTKDWNDSTNLLAASTQKFNSIDPKNLTKVNLSDLLNSILKTFESLQTLGKDASNAAQASISSASLSQSQIDSFYNSMLQVWSQSKSNMDKIQSTLLEISTITPEDIKNSQSQSNVAQKRSSVNNQLLAITSAQNDLDSATKNLIFTRNDYDNKIKQQQDSIKNLENSLALSKANYEFLLRWPTKEEIALQKNSIASQELALMNSKSNLSKYELRAPFDWVVNQNDIKAWDNIISNQQQYIYIENPNLVQLNATIDQLDVVKVKIWETARIVFDSFPTKTLEWRVEEVNTSPTQTSWVTTYNVKITLDKWDLQIFSWMSATINIMVQSKKWVLTLPSSFIQKRRDKAFVIVEDSEKKTWTWTRTEVVIWISNLLNSEIVSWVNEGDTVLRFVTTSTWSSAPWTIIPVGWRWGGNTGGWGSWFRPGGWG
ncbi:MAG: efflux transporter, RND family, MFP subunit [uncultured bacterium (gcode 4)]|uniref:Efflux transporter, RND family, MFP subunit n=1 Tax=uncultured bacterium (gcode 4) TaxID=1234023 RepID=K2G4G4_9BACT|nr:MAG: efflux transporter, RND family, MFP subunit [uncultured bacterium (gcode 4)]